MGFGLTPDQFRALELIGYLGVCLIILWIGFSISDIIRDVVKRNL